MANQGTANRISGHMGQDWAARLILWARCKLISPHPDIPLLPSSPLPPIVQAGTASDRRNPSIRRRISRNRSRRTGTSAIWYVTHRPCGRWLLSQRSAANALLPPIRLTSPSGQLRTPATYPCHVRCWGISGRSAEVIGTSVPSRGC